MDQSLEGQERVAGESWTVVAPGRVLEVLKSEGYIGDVRVFRAGVARPSLQGRAVGEPPAGSGRGPLAELVPVTGGLGLRRAWAATIDYTPDHLPIFGPGLRDDGRPIAGVTVASAGGHGMMWGPGVARVAADLAVGAPGEVERHRPQEPRAQRAAQHRLLLRERALGHERARLLVLRPAAIRLGNSIETGEYQLRPRRRSPATSGRSCSAA